MLPNNDQTPPDQPADRSSAPPLGEYPAPVTATDRLQTIYRSPGPYASVYMTKGDTVNGRFDRRIAALLDSLRADGASDKAVDAIEARLALPSPDDTAGIAVIAARDGTTIVDHGHEPPHHDFATVDELPNVAPLLVWQQHRVPHLVVTVDDDGADLAIFGLDHLSRLEQLDGDAATLAERTAEAANAIRAELILLAGEPSSTGPVGDELVTKVPSYCRIVTEPAHDSVDDLVDATVRQVSDIAARRTVRFLREHRFLDGHDAAVDGRSDTISELADGTATRLLIHDNPLDQERIWIGDDPGQLSTTQRTGYRQARVVDAMIRSAVLQGVPVHIIPSTGPDGPEEDMAALVDHSPQFDG